MRKINPGLIVPFVYFILLIMIYKLTPDIQTIVLEQTPIQIDYPEPIVNSLSNKNQMPYESHAAWINYAQKFKDDDSYGSYNQELQILQDQTNSITLSYCDRRKQYLEDRKIELDSRGLPIKDDWVIATDFPQGGGLFKIFKFNEFAQVLSVDENTRAMPTDADIFQGYTPQISTFRKIGTEFACDTQKWNHLLSEFTLSTKHKLVEVIKKYAENYKTRPQCFDPWSFTPKTYSLADQADCQDLKEWFATGTVPAGERWLWKQSGVHNAKGVFMLTQDNLRSGTARLQQSCESLEAFEKFPYIIQKYIQNPLTVEGRKFDLRLYILISSIDPLIVLYHDGFTRMSFDQYDADSNSKSTILTTASLYGDERDKEENQDAEINQSLEELADYLHKEGIVGSNWLDEYLKPQVKKSLMHLIRMSKPLWAPLPQTYEILGVDYMLDTDMNLWLLEIVTIPAMGGESEVKQIKQSSVQRGSVELATALLYNADFDAVLANTGYEWVHDGRKSGMEAYHGFIEEDCL